ncbi:protein phosphatase Slingshot homolog 3 isoform X3 [Phasianus colchicus]|uniref:protein phosphatase Slingshot homolog 3 isoform X3 n=1 Tax=Phasianus colchicus TaxID=9054 RepID=UPI00129E4A0B|nr:protein phosphatase Slingshot homolog 3 isoform X3 [Phasianus colchicus]
MALVTVRRAPGSAGVPPVEDDAPRRGHLQRRQSFALVRGAALLLPAEEPPASGPAPAVPPGRQERHLQLMMQLLRSQDAIQLAVQLESAQPQRVRYLLVVRPEEVGAEGQTALLGVDFPHEGADCCTLGMVLPLWSNTQVFLDGDGGFSVTSGGQTRIFKPISIQTMWAVLQELHRACELAAQGGHIPGGPALAWVQEYAAALDSEQSCLNEWLAMADLESVRPGLLLPTEPTERAVRALLRDVLTSADLESITSKEVRTELERRVGHSLEQHKDFIDNEMLLVLAQMDRPSHVFPHIYLGSEWNAANLEELQQNCVTHILNVAREIDNFFPALFNYMNVRVYDEETAQLLPHWNDTFLFLSDIKPGVGALPHGTEPLGSHGAGLRHEGVRVVPGAGAAPRPALPARRAAQPRLHAPARLLPGHPERQAAERAAEPEGAVPRDAGALPPSPPASSPPPEEDGRPGPVGAARRPRISLCAVMRSISQMETPENVEEPPGGEVSARRRRGAAGLRVADGGCGGTAERAALPAGCRSHRCPRAARGTRGAWRRLPYDRGPGPGRAAWFARPAWMGTACLRRSAAPRKAPSPAGSPARPAPRSPHGAVGQRFRATARPAPVEAEPGGTTPLRSHFVSPHRRYHQHSPARE